MVPPVLALWASPYVRAMAGVAVGLAVGEAANLAFHSGTQERKEEWKRRRIMHHGEFGCFASAAAAGIKSPFWGCIGIGLMLSDLDDLDEWFDLSKDRRGKWAEEIGGNLRSRLQPILSRNG